jgi:AraC-like DNA-binding protein
VLLRDSSTRFVASHRRIADPGGRQIFSRHTVGAVGLRVYALRLDGVVFDAGPLSAAASAMKASPSAPHVLTVVLDGEQLVRTSKGTVTVRAGRGLVAGGRGWNERWDGGSYRSLTIELEAPGVARPSEPREIAISATLRSAARALAERLERGDLAGAGVAVAVANLVARARAEALGFESLSVESLPLAPRDAQRVADCRSWVESHLDQKPMWIDWATRIDLSERQLRRRLAEIEPWCRLAGGSLRAQLRFLRAQAASMMLARDTDKVEAVAAALGYGSERALATSLAELGLPSPRALGRSVRLGG